MLTSLLYRVFWFDPFYDATRQTNSLVESSHVFRCDRAFSLPSPATENSAEYIGLYYHITKRTGSAPEIALSTSEQKEHGQRLHSDPHCKCQHCTARLIKKYGVVKRLGRIRRRLNEMSDLFGGLRHSQVIAMSSHILSQVYHRSLHKRFTRQSSQLSTLSQFICDSSRWSGTATQQLLPQRFGWCQESGRCTSWSHSLWRVRRWQWRYSFQYYTSHDALH